MNLKEICEQARARHGLTQRALANRINMSEANLSSAIAGRRNVTDQAAEVLSSLTGIGPWEIKKAGKAKAAKRGAAMIAAWAAIVGVSMFVSPRTADAARSGDQDATDTQSTDYPHYARLRRFRAIAARWLKSTFGAARPRAGFRVAPIPG